MGSAPSGCGSDQPHPEGAEYINFMNTLSLPLVRADGSATTLGAVLTTPKTLVIFTRHLN